MVLEVLFFHTNNLVVNIAHSNPINEDGINKYRYAIESLSVQLISLI